MIFKNNSGSLDVIKEIDFKNEKELQTLCEGNLKNLLNLEFVSTEFVVSDFRLDTVAYDEQANAFVIIEYKNNKNSSVIDQGYTYLSTMFNHKADFVLEYNRVTGKILGLKDIDWTQSKVLFISPHFTKYQSNAINFNDLPIELWKIKKFDNDTILFEEIRPIATSAKISSIAPKLENENKFVVKTDEENVTKNYTEDVHIGKANDDIAEIYNILKDFILDLDENIVIKPTKVYIGFMKNRRCVVSMKLQKGSIILWLNTDVDKLHDPQGLAKDVTNIGHHGNGNSQVQISDDLNIGYIQDIIRTYLEVYD